MRNSRKKSNRISYLYGKKIFLQIIFFIAFPFCFLKAQKRNNVWLIGNNVAVDFNQTPPVTFSGTPLKTLFPQYASSICDTSGSLLFYTDGENIWNKNNKKLVKKNEWWPWYRYTMPLLTVYPGNDSLFYLFAVSADEHRLKSITINSKEEGSIVYPPGSNFYNYYTPLLKNTSLMVAGTSHCNQKDVWIVAHSGSSFTSYLVSDKGIDTNGITSSFSASIIPGRTYERGNLKFSASGEKIVMPLIDLNKYCVFSFNNLTGRLSNPLLLEVPSNFSIGDVEISPDGSKLYYDAYYLQDDVELHRVYQMDLDAGDIVAIQNSATNLSPYPDREGCGRTCRYVDRSLQLAPDGKIYVTVQDVTNRANVIEDPNRQGVSATYNLSKLRFTQSLNCLNYNYIRSVSFAPNTFGIDVRKNNCSYDSIEFTSVYKNIDSIFWDFGDLPSGINNFSRDISARHLYPGPGSYTVTAILFHQCFIDTVKTLVEVSKDEVVKLPSFLKDTVICIGDEPIYNVTSPFATSYFWSDDGSANPVRSLTANKTYEVRAQNNCSIDVKRFKIDAKKCNCQIFVPSAFTPNHDGLNDIFKPSIQCFVKDYKFTIFSRFGNVIFSTSDPAKGWDGNMGKVAAENGTYVWLVKYYDPGTRKFFNKYGTISLIK